jgi:hypothetical protein
VFSCVFGAFRRILVRGELWWFWLVLVGSGVFCCVLVSSAGFCCVLEGPGWFWCVLVHSSGGSGNFW